jgi:hypothetical protein
LEGIKVEKRVELMESLLERIGQKNDLKSLDIFMKFFSDFFSDVKEYQAGFANALKSRGILGKMANMKEKMLSKVDIPGTIRFLR